MKDKPNKDTVKDGLPTAEQVLRETYHEYGIEYKPSQILADSVAPIAMQSYSDQQNAQLRERIAKLESGEALGVEMVENLALKERVKELESENERMSKQLDVFHKHVDIIQNTMCGIMNDPIHNQLEQAIKESNSV